MRIGTVLELWRHPVKSMGGESMAAAEIGLTGLAGDRHWAVLDGESGEIRGAKRWPELLRCRARYAGDGPVTTADYDSRVQAVILSGPDGQELRSDAPDRDAVLTSWLGRAVTLSPRHDARDLAHYRLAQPRTAESIAAEMALQDGEEFPDYSDLDAATMGALADSATPPGSYVDAFPLHLISRNALAWFAGRSGLDTDPRRFRANLVVDVEGAGNVPAEDEWSGYRLAIGEAVLRIDSRTVRCAMPGRPQPHFGLADQPSMTGALVRQANRRLGVNVLVERPGYIRVGDPIHRLD
ncbi:MAG: MOSC domain-containing protein [Proteobacteria bacterium]|nr:MOSC domain-containing protein [Pseudomonadota bacterium]HQR04843.1 MOSC domain-containing protein [Rhodocyclaceae bacterium]